MIFKLFHTQFGKANSLGKTILIPFTNLRSRLLSADVISKGVIQSLIRQTRIPREEFEV